MIDLRRGDVVLVSFPFAEAGGGYKRRPAVVVQADRYRKRAAVMLAAITSAKKRSEIACKVDLEVDTDEGRAAGIRMSSVIDCQTLVTLLRSDVVAHLGHLAPETQARVDRALEDALGLRERSG